MDLRQLEAFRAIATMGSFSAAAEKLRTTQPAISSRIRALEEELGAELFDRASRPARLTPTGHRLVRHVERIFEATTDIRRAAGGLRDRISSARIGIPGALVGVWAPYLMSKVYGDAPQARMELHIDRSVQLREMMANGELDFALVIGPVNEPDLIAHPVASYGYVWITQAGQTQREPPRAIAEVSGPVITYSKNSSVFRELTAHFKAEGHENIELSGSNSTEAIIEMVSKGLGLGVVMTVALSSAGLDTMRVRPLDLDTRMVSNSEYWCIYRRDGDILLGEYLAEASLNAPA